MKTDRPISRQGAPAGAAGETPTAKPSPGRNTPDPIPPRASMLRFQGAANRVVRVLLRTPVICRAIGRLLVIVYVVGRKTGTRYVVPVAYARHDGALLIGTPFGWARNLRSGEPVDIRIKGRLRRADVEVITDETGVVEAYAVMARGNHNFAAFNKISFDPAGNPDPTDLRLAWAAGARAIRLTPH